MTVSGSEQNPFGSLIASGFLSADKAESLAGFIQQGSPILVSGSVGSGRAGLASAVASLIPGSQVVQNISSLSELEGFAVATVECDDVFDLPAYLSVAVGEDLESVSSCLSDREAIVAFVAKLQPSDRWAVIGFAYAEDNEIVASF